MGNLLANGGLTVHGDASFLANVDFGGHITTSGNAPATYLDEAAGLTVAPPENPGAATASGSVDGNDISGQFTVNVGDSSTAGNLISMTFKKTYAKAPHVFLTANNGAAAQLKYYVTSTTTGFKVVVTDPIPAGTSLQFNYLVAQ
jgi:hypothetical protein